METPVYGDCNRNIADDLRFEGPGFQTLLQSSVSLQKHCSHA